MRFNVTSVRNSRGGGRRAASEASEASWRFGVTTPWSEQTAVMDDAAASALREPLLTASAPPPLRTYLGGLSLSSAFPFALSLMRVSSAGQQKVEKSRGQSRLVAPPAWLPICKCFNLLVLARCGAGCRHGSDMTDDCHFRQLKCLLRWWRATVFDSSTPQASPSRTVHYQITKSGADRHLEQL